MKKILVILFVSVLLLTSCSSVILQDIDDISENIQIGSSAENSEVCENSENDTSDNAVQPQSKVRFVEIKHTETMRYIPSSTSAETITDEECEAMVIDRFDEVLAIAKEFYGLPAFLFVQIGVYDSETMPITEVQVLKEVPEEWPIRFENDADFLRATVSEYFTERLIEDKFSLEFPCPIYEEPETKKLFRTICDYTPGGEQNCDISSGRIISRENGIVKYGFPIYSMDLETHEPYTDFWFLGYMDFVYENGKWKVDDFYLSDKKYDTSTFGRRHPARMDDFFEFEEELIAEGVTATLNNGTDVTLNVNGKEITAELDFNAGRISKIEHIGENIFVSFRGAFEKDETFVISESGELIERFVSNGYTATEEGDWYYVAYDRENGKGDIFNKQGTPIVNFVLPKELDDDYYSLPEIAPIEEIEVDEDGFTITYDTTAY